MYKEISVVLPAFNEEGNIEKAVTNADAYLKKGFLRYEIIVVNDGSRDKTKVIVQKLIKTYKHLKLINLPVNKGYGGCLRAGFYKAKYDLIFYTDSDNQFDIREIRLLMDNTKRYDIICGFRKNRKDPFTRVFAAFVYNVFINLLFNLKLRDVDCAFKIYKKAVFDKISLHANTVFIDTEILVKARKAGFTFAPQIPVSHYPRLIGASTYEIGPRSKFFVFVNPRTITDILAEIKKLWKELYDQTYA